MKSDNIVIRKLSIKDIPNVISISKRIFGVTDNENWHHAAVTKWEDRFNKNGALLGAYVNGLLVGYKFGYEKSPERFHSWMGGVLREYRGQKIATHLLKHQENLIKEKGYKEITVNTIESKYPIMLKFLKKHGYVVDSVSEQKEFDNSVVLKSHLKKKLKI